MEEYKSIKKTVNGVLGLYSFIKLFFLFSSLFLGIALKTLLSLFFSGDKLQQVFNQFLGYGTLPGLLLSLILSVLSLAVPICIYMFLSGKRIKTTFRSRRPTVLQVGYSVSAAYFLGMAALLVSQVLLSLLFSLFGMQDKWKAMLSETSAGPTNFWLIPLFFVVLAVLPGFLEEFLVRGIGLSATEKLGNGFTILFCGFFFGLMHNTWIQIPFATVLGCVLAYFTLKFDSIWVAVLAHFFYNFNSGFLSLLQTNVPEEHSIVATLIYVFLWGSLMAALLIAGIIVYGVRLPKPEQPCPVSFGKKLGVLFCSPFFYLFLILSVAVLFLQLLLY